MIQYCLENPFTGAMRHQPYMSYMMTKSTTVDYCRYETLHEDGEWVKYPYRKPTMLCSNIPDIQSINKRCTCPNFRHFSSIIGDKANGKKFDHRGGVKATMEMKHAVPTELHLEVLKRAQKAEPNKTWVLDLFSGTQSLKKATNLLEGVKYVSVDIEARVKTVDGDYVETDIVRDLTHANITKLIKQASRIVNERPQDLLLLFQPPLYDI